MRPVYYLMGEEGYYIDHLVDFLVDSLLQPQDRDFNLITFFGAETDMQSVVHAAMGFPMGAERLVVVVREAQNLKDTAPLDTYLKSLDSPNAQPTAVLILCHMNAENRPQSWWKRWACSSRVQNSVSGSCQNG